MLKLSNRVFIPLGVSCINQFQLNFAFGIDKSTGGLLDWNITTPAATLEILKSHLDNTLADKLTERAAYQLDSVDGHLINIHFPGMYFWHEEGAAIVDDTNPQVFEAFASKLRNTSSALTAAGNHVDLLWSNVQPNLEAAVTTRTARKLVDFRLEHDVYDNLTDLVRQVYPNGKLHFITRIADCCPSLLDKANVWPMELARSPEYKGPPELYQELFDSILESHGDPVAAA